MSLAMDAMPGCILFLSLESPWPMARGDISLYDMKASRNPQYEPSDK